jgi:hypothetical protein
VRVEVVAALRRDGATVPRVRRAVRELVRYVPQIAIRPGDWRVAVTGRGNIVRLDSDPRTLLELTRQPGQLAILDAGAMVRAAQDAVDRRHGAT